MTLRSFANAITAYVPVSVISPRYLLRKSQLQIFKLTKLSVAQIEQHWTLYNINCHLKFANLEITLLIRVNWKDRLGQSKDLLGLKIEPNKP